MPYAIEDEKALQELMARIDASWTGRDAKVFASCFAEESTFRYHTGRTLQGREQIEKNYLASFAARVEQERHVTTIHHIRFLRPDVAILDSQVEIWRQQELRLHLLSTFVTTKESGKWLISNLYLMVPVN